MKRTFLQTPLRSSVRLALTTAAIVAIAAAAMMFLSTREVRRHAVREAQVEARQLLGRNLAIHAYLNQHLKPRVFELREAADAPDSHFDPVWMSSTYAVREIDRHYQELSRGAGYYYKECAANARSPENEADPFERAFLAKLNADPSLEEFSRVREIDGLPYLVFLRRGEVMEEACLRCHGDPAEAPRDLVERYGPERSFHREVGEVVSAVSIRVPLDAAFAEARDLTYQLSALTGVAFLALFLAQLGLGRKLLFRPLEGIRTQALGIATDRDRLGQQVQLAGGRELQDLARAFNTMSSSLRQSHNHLEELVEERTAELREANERLARDLTERRRVERQLSEARQAAEDANRAKSAFLANMSHEIRTPLNGLTGMIELVLDSPLSPEQRDYLRMAQGSADSLLDIINDVLDLSKIEAGHLDLDEISFDLWHTAERAVETFSVSAHRKGLELALWVAPDVPEHLVGDPSRLRQVLVNLIGNAVKFTDAGEIVVQVDRASDFDPSRPSLRFSVRDTGVGVPDGFRHRLFDAFSQADGSTTRKYGGTGLGLAISKRLVEAMGGDIGVEDGQDRGSTFWFTAEFLPGEAPPQSTHRVPVAGLRGLRALVVDDNDTNRLILKEMLGRWGLAADGATGGPEALAALTREAEAGTPYFLVLLDFHMPGMDGYQVAEALGDRTELGDPAVLVLTSAGLPEESDRHRPDTVSACLLKPVKRLDLLEAVRGALGNREARAEARGAADGEAAAESSSVSLRLLLAEDNPVNEKLARALLEKRGWQVTSVGDGEAAVRAWEEGGFDLVLMDVQMPGMDGFTAAAEIRERERAAERPRTPVVAMTAYALDGDRERCLAAGMDDYVAKPVRREDLYAAVERSTSTAGSSGPRP